MMRLRVCCRVRRPTGYVNRPVMPGWDKPRVRSQTGGDTSILSVRFQESLAAGELLVSVMRQDQEETRLTV